MRKEITEEVVPAYTRKHSKYISDGGKEFTDENDCIDYEERVAKKLYWDSITKITIPVDFPDLGESQWFYCKTQEEVDFVLKEHDSYVYWYGKGAARINTWFGIHYVDGGDYRGSNYVFTLEEIKQEFTSFLARIESIGV